MREGAGDDAVVRGEGERREYLALEIRALAWLGLGLELGGNRRACLCADGLSVV